MLLAGLGGVGSWCAEALVRSGLGSIAIVDSDLICESNINRQLHSTSRSLGRPKAEVMEERLKEINPFCEVKSFHRIFSADTVDIFGIPEMDYVIDAIDTLNCKLDLIETALAAGKCLFSSMGMAGKLDPTLIRTADIWDTSACPLARLVRQGLIKRNITGHFTAVYSTEKFIRREAPKKEDGRIINGSAVTVTAAAGMVLASLVIRDICERYE